jgi:hypothetical protein
MQGDSPVEVSDRQLRWHSPITALATSAGQDGWQLTVGTRSGELCIMTIAG